MRTQSTVFFSVLSLLAGCEEPDAKCNTMAAASVMLEVTDQNGDPIEGVTAEFSSDGATVEELCEELDGTFVCGYEVAGPIVVTISAPGQVTHTETIVVEAGECHVQGVSLTVALEPVECTDEIRPSVVVSLTDEQGTAITEADVTWNHEEEDDLPEPCVYLQDNQWACAEEIPGNLLIEVSNAGPYEPFSRVVTVEEDDCHVQTEDLDVVLAYLPD